MRQCRQSRHKLASLVLLLLGLVKQALTFPIGSLTAPSSQARASQPTSEYSLPLGRLDKISAAARSAFGRQATDTCPFPYQRLTAAEVRAGSTPYLFGGSRKPCGSCQDGDIADFCQFLRPSPDQHRHFQHTAHICSKEQQQQFVQWALQLQFNELLEFTPCDFWSQLQGRTLWILGDSQALDLYIASICFMREFWDLSEKDVPTDEDTAERLASLVSQRILESPRCAHLPEGARICFVRMNTGEHLVQEGLPVLQPLLNGQGEAVVVLNFGLWHHDEKVYRQLLLQLAEQVQAGLLPPVLWKDTNPQHFNRSDGAFVGGEVGSLPFTCQPIDQVELQPDHSLNSSDPEKDEILEGLWRNRAAREVLRPLGIPFVETFNDTVPLWDFHRSNVGRGLECGHYCHPSAPQMWVWSMFDAIRKHASPQVHLRHHTAGLPGSDGREYSVSRLHLLWRG